MGAGKHDGDGLHGVVLVVQKGTTVVQAVGGPAAADTGRACTPNTTSPSRL